MMFTARLIELIQEGNEGKQLITNAVTWIRGYIHGPTREAVRQMEARLMEKIRKLVVAFGD